MRHHAPFVFLLALYLATATAYALVTPAWQAPDEPAHYRYVAQLAAGDWPVMAPGDYDQAYQSAVISSEFDPALPLTAFSYEDYQPPLYYLAATPMFAAAGGALTAVRLVSVALGAGVVALTYAVGRRVVPRRPWVALTAVALVGLLPQHLALLGSVNNDALAWLLVAALLWQVTRLDSAESPPTRSQLASLGLLLGAAFLTKVTAYLMAPVVGLWLLWRYRGDWAGLARVGAWCFGPALALGALWWGRNIVVYPGLDFLGTQAHDAVVAGQPTTAQWVADFGLVETVRRLVETTFRSFWGQFGWMAAPLPGWAYRPILLATVLAAVGLAARARRGPWPRRSLLLVFGALPALNLALYLAYNVTYVQHQGRYLFAGLLPLALAAAVGLEWWLRPLIARRPWTGYLLPAGVALGLLALNGWALWRILPCLAYDNPFC